MRALLLLLLSIPSGAQTITTVNENLALSSNTFLIDTNIPRLDIGTAAYTGGIPGVALFVGSNTVIGTGTGVLNQVVIYATGAITLNGKNTLTGTVGITSSCPSGYYLSTGTWLNGVTTGGSCAAAPAAAANASATWTRQVFSVPGCSTYSTPPNTIQIRITGVGGGGGGGGTTAGPGIQGSSTSFSTFLVAGGGIGGNGPDGSASGAGGSSSFVSTDVVSASTFAGGAGASAPNVVNGNGGNGGSSILGGSGAGGPTSFSGIAGSTGAMNTGGGGGGASGSGNVNTGGSGGGAGGAFFGVVNSPSASYLVCVGAGGQGSGSNSGGPGGSGILSVDELYPPIANAISTVAVDATMTGNGSLGLPLGVVSVPVAGVNLSTVAPLSGSTVYLHTDGSNYMTGQFTAASSSTFMSTATFQYPVIIGTTSASTVSQLAVHGNGDNGLNTQISWGSSSVDYAHMSWSATGSDGIPTPAAYIYPPPPSHLEFGSATSTTVLSGHTIVDNWLGVNLGKTRPQSTLDVGGNVSIGEYAGNNAAPNNGLAVSGSVGIGTPSPTSFLQIAGLAQTQPFNAAALSNTGQHQVMAVTQGNVNALNALLMSHDYGATWQPTNEYINCAQDVISADGQIVLAAGFGQGVKISKDSGATWADMSPPGTDPSTGGPQQWDAAGESFSGSTMAVAVNHGDLYISTNAGVSWTAKGIIASTGSDAWNWIGVSGDGNTILAAMSGPGAGSGVYMSTNAGSTFSLNFTSGTNVFYGVAADYNGKILISQILNDYVYVSTNSGTSWFKSVNVAATWAGIGISSDGTHMISTSGTTPIYVSTDTGSTWIQESTSRSRQAANISGDFSHMTVGDFFGPIETSTGSSGLAVGVWTNSFIGSATQVALNVAGGSTIINSTFTVSDGSSYGGAVNFGNVSQTAIQGNSNGTTITLGANGWDYVVTPSGVNVGISSAIPSFPLTVTGAIFGTSSATASAFFGDGAHLTGIPASTVTTNTSMIGTGTAGNLLGVNASSVAVLNASGFVLNSQIDPSSVTKQGNVFNGNSQLVQTTSGGLLPALSAANLTGTAASLTAGNVTTNANLTGPVTSAGNVTTIAGPVPVAGVNLSTVAPFSGSTVYLSVDGSNFMTGQLTTKSSATVKGAGGIAVTFGVSAATGVYTGLVSASSFTSTNAASFATSGGFVGVGTGSPKTLLQVHAGTLTVDDNGTYGGKIYMGTTGAEAFSCNDPGTLCTIGGGGYSNLYVPSLIGANTNNPTTAITIYGVLTSSTTQGTVSCTAGTPVLSATATDQHGSFVAGSLATACTYTFKTAWPQIPDCICQGNLSTINVVASATSKTAVTCTGASAITGDTITFTCWSAP